MGRCVGLRNGGFKLRDELTWVLIVPSVIDLVFESAVKQGWACRGWDWHSGESASKNGVETTHFRRHIYLKLSLRRKAEAWPTWRSMGDMIRYCGVFRGVEALHMA
jgi:hypothetical protein